MSKVNQIQQALLELSGGKFQTLADAYLKESGYDRVNSIGSVIGSDKAKAGTPDTLITLPNGNYIFAEHTTKQDGLKGKIRDDIKKCLDDQETGVPTEKIERLIFCFTADLDAEQENELAEMCREEGVSLELLGIDSISFDLYQKYPGLARDFLGVEIDTGQIVPPNQFVELYNRSRLAADIDLPFHFREDELKQILTTLETENLILLSGKAGVGKTRLALEGCRKYQEEHTDYEVWCIFGRQRDLWDDMKVRFSKPGKFLILVDDANRISRFEYIVDLLQHQREDQQIKVVATVRDYALSKVRDAMKPLAGAGEVKVTPFSDEQISDLIRDACGIQNPLYLDRITELSEGYPRLAVMAAEVVTQRETLESIRDVSALYEQYYSSVKADLQDEEADLENPTLLKVAGIVSFFDAVDRTNEKMMRSIEEAFDISSEKFWEMAYRLHEMEIIDMYENEVVREADQVLGTFLFYQATFEEEVLSFGTLLDHFFPEMKDRLIDSVNPVLSALDDDKVTKVMRQEVERVWSKIESEGNEEVFLHLLSSFGTLKTADTLNWVRQRIDELNQEPIEAFELNYAKSANSVSASSVLGVLRQFAQVREEEVRIALELMMRYLGKKPGEVSGVLRLLIDQYGFVHNSHTRRFEVQHAVIDVLWQHAKEGDPLFVNVFLAVAENYLHTHFKNHRMKDAQRLQIRQFDLPATEGLAELRKKIWNRIFALFQEGNTEGEVLETIHEYATSPNKVRNTEVINQDRDLVLPFLESTLDPEKYWHCAIFHDYLDLLERQDLEVEDESRKCVWSETYALAEVLLPDRGELRALDPEMSHEEYQKARCQQIDEHTGGYTIDDYAHLLRRSVDIYESLEKRQDRTRLRQGVVDVLLTLGGRDFDLCMQVSELYLSNGEPLNLNPSRLVRKLIEKGSPEEVFELLNRHDYPNKKRWLFRFHQALPVEKATEERLEHVYGLYDSASRTDLPNDWDYLLKYRSIDQMVIPQAVSKTLNKVDEEPDHSFCLEMLFNPHTDVSRDVINLFEGDIGVLKEAYFVADETVSHADYQGKIFNRILNVDREFIAEYVDRKYETSDKGWVSPHGTPLDFSFLWEREDYEEVMERAVESVIENEKEKPYTLYTYARVFFESDRERKKSSEIATRQDSFLLEQVADRSDESHFVEKIFGIISQFSPDRRRKFIKQFVEHNKSFEDFKRLTLEPQSRSATGSWVPVVQKRMEFFESLLPIMDSAELLQHRQYVEHRIQALKSRMKQEKKKDFVRG